MLANATPITDLFDFAKPRLLDPPPLPAPVIDAVQEARCKEFGAGSADLF